MAGLLAVISCITILDVTTPINCQVGTVFYVDSLEPCLTCDNYKLWTLISVVSTHSYAFLFLKRESLSPRRFFLVPFLSVCDHRIVIDRSPHVRRRHLQLHKKGNFVLIDVTSVAIWKRNKVVLAVAITIWASDIAFHLQSEPLPSSTQKI